MKIHKPFADKNAITVLDIEIVNDDAENTFYVVNKIVINRQ